MDSRISPDEFKTALLTKEGFVRFVLDHNLPAVNKKLQDLQISTGPVDRQTAYNIIRNLDATGQHATVVKILDVPANPNATNGTEDYLPHVAQVAKTYPIKPLSN